jgi:hypothetical protein
MRAVILQVLMFACFAMFVAVTVSLAQLKGRHAIQRGARPLSATAWVVRSLLAVVVWVVLSFILSVGHNRGATGIRGVLGIIVLYGGPVLYLRSGYRLYGLLRTPSPEDSNPAD